MSRSPVACNNVYDVLEADMGDDNSVVDDFHESPLASAMLRPTPTLDATATLAIDTVNTTG